MDQVKTWDEFYKSRVRNEDYTKAFTERYNRFLAEVILNIKRVSHKLGASVILKEEGCGIGTVSKVISSMEEKLVNSLGLTSVSEIKEIKKVVLADNNNAMLDLCLQNICPLFTGGYLGTVPFFYSRENICEEKFFESATMVVTHGVLEHFADEDIMQIMATYKNKNVLFQAHYVPTDRYEEGSFGDERLLPAQQWINLIEPDYYILDNNECDLYLFKTTLK